MSSKQRRMPVWRPIADAPKDRTLLVNDTTYGASPWVAAYYIDSPDWSGWAYDDAQLSDANPLGPQPTHFYDVPPPPGGSMQTTRPGGVTTTNRRSKCP